MDPMLKSGTMSNRREIVDGKFFAVDAEDRARALAMFDVSRETTERLDRFIDLLLTWQRHTNLIGASTIPSLWTRHVADSLQLLALAPNAQKSTAPVWVDLGTGGGFPGLVIACALAETPGARIHLIESSSKKARFLRDAVRETAAPAIVHEGRIETVAPKLASTADVVTARALAPLSELLALVAPFIEKGAQALLMKGQDVDIELTTATKYWNVVADIVPSKTSPSGRILMVRRLGKREMPRSGFSPS
jgi:16S rRNA (guanine527-N7)-methyltransferase